MCCFSRPVRQVSATQIFARQVGDGRQALVYSMQFEIEEELAMVLPIPVVPGCGDDAVQFIDLEGYPTFFADVDKAFPTPPRNNAVRGMMMLSAQAAPSKPLAVHEVGAFVASFVPSLAEFTRLDARFRMPDRVFASHTEYADWGFAVFQLSPTRGTVAKPKRRWFRRAAAGAPAGPQTVHPMAFTFPSRRPRALYFPTLHVHDGDAVPREADYDHLLVCQSDDVVLTKTFAWRVSPKPLGKSVNARRSHGVIDPDALAYRRQIVGRQPNIDHWFEAPTCAGPHMLAGRGEKFAFELATTAAYYTVLDSEPSRAWHTTARTRIDELHAGMLAELAAMVTEHGDAWALAPLPPSLDSLRTLWLSNDQPHEFTTTGPTPVAVGRPGPFLLSLGASSARVERQNVQLVFATAPSAQTIGAIQKAIAGVLDRAIPA